MKGNEAIEARILERIVALLFSLADLAEQASRRSYPVRCFILWLLHRAERVATDWIWADGAGDVDRAPWADDQPPAVGACHRNGTADALHLADTFRALARALRRQLLQERQLARRLTRRKGDQTVTDPPPRHLFATGRTVLLARAIGPASSNAGNRSYALAPRLDTS